MDTSKIIIGTVGGGRYTVTAPIVKEDYGLYLKIEGLELPSTYEVDFSNSEHNGTSVTMIGNSDGVLIPSQFISSGKDVFAFLYHVGADFGRTVYKFRIPNKLRPDRTDEQPTPEEQSTIDQAISALNSAVEQTAQDVIDADASAQSASDDADRAEQAKNDASTFAQRSAQSAQASADYSESAQASASASANSASQSAQIKEDVESMVEEAQASATASAQSASTSANSASQASGYAQSASASAQSASGHASNAQTSAQTASAKASEASTSAQTASAKASEASGYATTASNKATEASGYATSASQAKTDAESARDSAQGYASDARGYAENAQASAESISASASQIAKNTADILKAFPTDTASGAVASFTDGADNIPLKSLIVNIDPVQDTSGGDPSPTNICPISGWEGCEVNATGYNVWDEEWEVGGIEPSNGRNNEHTNRLRSKNYIPCRPSATYWFKKADNAQSYRTIYYDKEQAFIESSNSMSASAEFTTPDNCYFVRFFSMNPVYSGDISINYPSTDHSYHPYTGRSITINLGQTVYGGKLDVLGGVLTVDRAMVDLGTLSWVYNSTGYNTKPFCAPLTNALLPPKSSVIIPALCSMYPQIAPNKMNTPTNDKCFGIGHYFSGQHEIQILDTAYTDATAFKAAVTGQTLVYELATPITIQLTPNQVNSLLGVNNIWADSGDTEVEYRADTKLFIERLTAPDSADMIADSNIVSGQYFMVGNSLYKATANIANGGQIVVGTNCTKVSLAQALNEINA